jgi:Dynamin central region
VSEGTEPYWLKVFHNEVFPFEYGYYMTCQRTSGQRAAKITHEQARENEDKFFEETHPWCEEQNERLFGTKNLLKAISGLLSKMIAQRYELFLLC